MFSPCVCRTLHLCGNDAVDDAVNSTSNHLRRNYTNNIHLNQLQPQEVENIGKVDCLFASWHIWHQMVRSNRKCKTICSSPFRIQVDIVGPARAEPHSKNQERNPWSYMSCQFLHLHHNVSRVVHNTGPIDFFNKGIQASDATLDMEVANIENLFAQLVTPRDSWKAIWNEAKLV